MDNALVYERFIVNHLNPINDTIDLVKLKRLPEQFENELHNRIKPLYDDECKFMFMKI